MQCGSIPCVCTRRACAADRPHVGERALARSIPRRALCAPSASNSYAGVAQEAARIAEMYEKHDTDKSGGLHEGQLKSFMQEYVQTLQGHESKVVTDAEAHYVMSIADTMHDGEVEKGDITEAIAVSHKRALACTSSSFLRAAVSGPRRDLIRSGHVQIWQALLADEDVIALRFDVYDKNKSGELDSTQVAEALKDLNGGKAPTADDVKWVIERTDGRVVRLFSIPIPHQF